ncbi:MAG: cyanoexosortase A [Cyanobacteria bacterium J06623_7]
MSVSSFLSKVRLSPWLLLTLLSGLACIHLGLSLKLGRYSFLAISLVFWLAISSTIGDRYRTFKYESDWLSSILGSVCLLLCLGLGKVLSPSLWLNFAPVVFILGTALVASGSKNLRDYRPELIIMATLSIPKLLLPLIPDISTITAKFSAFWLYYCGFDVILSSTTIILTKGGVEVIPSCSGLNLMLYMFGLAIVFLVMFPLFSSRLKIISVVTAIAIGFVTNSVRVAILALCSGSADRTAFEYWHSQDGALIFVTISVLLYGCYCWLLLRHHSLRASP